MGCGASSDTGGGGSSASKSTDGAQRRKNYTRLDVLGRGASCEVVEVESKEDRKKYAMKILSKGKGFSEDLFRHEIDILQTMSHKNILKMTEFFEDQENFYLITIVCKGGELFDRIVDPDFVFTEKIACKYVRTMFEALKFCHDQGVVHRDLKPENYIFETETAHLPILIDFGCALRVEDDTIYHDNVGTPFYVAPESAGMDIPRSGKTLKASDVWAIGVITFCMLSGRPPFSGKKNKEIFKSICTDKIKFSKRDNISRALRKFLEKKILVKQWEGRVTCDQALEEKWVRGKDVSNKEIPAEALESLRQFQYNNRLKRELTKVLAANMSDKTLREIRLAFNNIDVDGSGYLDVYELGQLLATELEYDTQTASREAEKMMTAHGKERDGLIAFDEFAEDYQRNLLYSNKQYMKCVFEVLDENGNGLIDAEELQMVLQLGDLGAIKDIITEVDRDGDGMINFDEFQDAMAEQILGGV